MQSGDIFAGPIIRRAQQDGVAIWLAMTVPVKLVFTIRVAGTEKWIGYGYTGDQRPIKVFPGLYVHLVVVRPSEEPFPTNKLLEYSIGVIDGNGKEDHEPFQAIVKEDELSYRGHALPTFYLQARGQKLNVLYASCRKIHDSKGGKRDALSYGDQLISTNTTNFTIRPAALCLMGDQIYADDVDVSVFREIRRIAVAFCQNSTSADERLPGGLPLPAEGRRQDFVHKHAAFTSSEAANHLITLAEYAAMYGIAWNPRNWQLTPFVAEVEPFIKDLSKVRRLLANTPTYMIFDDHDVTDDWNLCLDWQTKVYATPLGRRILGNALYAFWLFQGWGNDPSRHEAVLPEIRALNSARESQPDKPYEFFAKFHTWEFFTPTYPFVYFLDTRTQRGYRDGIDLQDTSAPAYLKTVESWKLTMTRIKTLRARQSQDYPLVFVAPAPVFGFEAIDKAQRAVSGLVGPYAFDLEGWAANLRHLLLFLRICSDQNVVLLSGDVHYSYTSTIRFTSFDDAFMRLTAGRYNLIPPVPLAGPRPTYKPLYSAKFLQLTSSAAKNYASSVLKRLSSGAPKHMIFVRFMGGAPVAEKGTLENGVVTVTRLVGANEVPVNAKLEEYQPSCALYQRLNDPYNSPYISEHNIGFATFEGKTVTNCFLVGLWPAFERTWDFRNGMCWEGP